MSREIKFRAWHRELNTFIKVDAIDFTGEAFHTGEPVAVNSQINGGVYLLKNCVIEQFTGLHDKNGKEIYEGDRISYYGERMVVEWVGALPMWKAADGKCAPLQSGTNMLVIGNIHEHRELLEAE